MKKTILLILLQFHLQAKSQTNRAFFVEKYANAITGDTINFTIQNNLYLNFAELADHYFFTYSYDKNFKKLSHEEYYAPEKNSNSTDTFRIIYEYDNDFNSLQNSLRKKSWRQSGGCFHNENKHTGDWYIYQQFIKIKKSNSEIFEYVLNYETGDSNKYNVIKKQYDNDTLQIEQKFENSKLITEILEYTSDGKEVKEVFDLRETRKMIFKVIKEFKNHDLYSETTYDYSRSSTFAYRNFFNQNGSIQKQQKYTIDLDKLILERDFYY